MLHAPGLYKVIIKCIVELVYLSGDQHHFPLRDIRIIAIFKLHFISPLIEAAWYIILFKEANDCAFLSSDPDIF